MWIDGWMTSRRFNLSGEAYTSFMVFISFLLKRRIFFVFADRLVLQYHSNEWKIYPNWDPELLIS